MFRKFIDIFRSSGAADNNSASASASAARAQQQAESEDIERDTSASANIARMDRSRKHIERRDGFISLFTNILVNLSPAHIQRHLKPLVACIDFLKALATLGWQGKSIEMSRTAEAEDGKKRMEQARAAAAERAAAKDERVQEMGYLESMAKGITDLRAEFTKGMTDLRDDFARVVGNTVSQTPNRPLSPSSSPAPAPSGMGG